MGVSERRSREKGNRLQSIQDAARTLFFQKGFPNTSMEEIASLAEIGKGTIYLYFKNKNDLYTSILVEGLENLRCRLLEIEADLDGGRLNSTEDIVIAFFKMNYEVYRQNADSIFYQSHQLNQFLLNLSKEYFERLNRAAKDNFVIARRIISKAIDKRLFPRFDPAQVIDVFRVVVLGNIQIGESRTIFAQKDYFKDNLRLCFVLLSKAFQAIGSESKRKKAPNEKWTLTD